MHLVCRVQMSHLFYARATHRSSIRSMYQWRRSRHANPTFQEIQGIEIGSKGKVAKHCKDMTSSEIPWEFGSAPKVCGFHPMIDLRFCSSKMRDSVEQGGIGAFSPRLKLIEINMMWQQKLLGAPGIATRSKDATRGRTTFVPSTYTFVPFGMTQVG